MKNIEGKRNLLIWLLLWTVFVFTSSRHLEITGALVVSTVNTVPLIIVTYIIRRGLIPTFLQRNHRKHFYILTILLIVIASPLSAHIDAFTFRMLDSYAGVSLERTHRYQIETASQETGYVLLMAKWLILLLSASASTIIAWLLTERKRLEDEAREQHMQNELKYLKAQINPHFLFNSLNCIYSLTMTQDEQAPDSVLKLSEMLRYVIDDCAQDEVPIAKEINYINNYLDFQRIRMEHARDITFETEVDDSTFPIPPMIFQPMIENCFKHSRIVDHAEGFVHIHLKQEPHRLSFYTENSISQLPYKGNDNERIGIGLQNVEQRLRLIFGNKVTFEKEETDNIFKIALCIKY